MSSRNSAYRLVSKMDQGVGHRAQRLVYSEEDLLISLSNSLRQRDHEIAGRASLKGRLMALFVGKDSGDTIRIDGMRLMQLLDLADGKAPEGIVLAGFYDVDLAFFRALLAKVLPEGASIKVYDQTPAVVRR